MDQRDIATEEPLPRSFHNLFVIVVTGFLALWAAKVAYQIFSVADLNNRLRTHMALPLPGMSIFTDDFQVLIRQHFNQILRIRRTAPTKRLVPHKLSCHLRPESMTLWSGEAAVAREDGKLGVRFSVDCVAPCRVQLFWGLKTSAANDFIRNRQGSQPATTPERSSSSSSSWRAGTSRSSDSSRSLLEMGAINGGGGDLTAMPTFGQGQCAQQSREVELAAGEGQVFASGEADFVDPVAPGMCDLGAPWLRDSTQAPEAPEPAIPLAIAVVAPRRRTPTELGSVQGTTVLDAQGQLTFVKFGRSGPEVVKQVSFGDRNAHELQGIFGFEEDGESDCMICYARPKNILLLPCRHCSVCRPCLRSLRDEKCPLCRSTFTSYVTFPITRAAAAAAEAENNPAAEAPSGGAAGGATGSAAAGGSAPALGTGGGMPGGDGGAGAVGAGAPGAMAPSGGPLASALAPVGTGFSAAATGGAAAPVAPNYGSLPPASERPARERPRGTASAASRLGQGLRLTGRARFKDPTDTAQEPLLADGPSIVPGGGCIREDNAERPAMLHPHEDETRVLIQSRE